MATDKKLLENVSTYLNDVCKSFNFKVADTMPTGKPAKVTPNTREFRIQLINKNNDTSSHMKKELPQLLASNKDISNIKFHELSENSSKYSSVSFTISGQRIDVVIAKGANKGETFEVNTVKQLHRAFHTNSNDEYADLIKHMIQQNPAFAKNEITSVKQRTGSTKKENVPIEQLGAIIGDIVLKDSSGKDWFISLKDVNGDTFSSYSGAASLFNNDGDLQENSEGSKFVASFGADLNEIQAGFDLRNKKKKLRKPYKATKADSAKIAEIFKRAWGMNYFYVRKQRTGWKVFWLDSAKLNKLVSGIKVSDIKYPTAQSKQITISCYNSYAKYKIEIRNSKGGEYPNDIKFKIAEMK